MYYIKNENDYILLSAYSIKKCYKKALRLCRKYPGNMTYSIYRDEIKIGSVSCSTDIEIYYKDRYYDI